MLIDCYIEVITNDCLIRNQCDDQQLSEFGLVFPMCTWTKNKIPHTHTGDDSVLLDWWPQLYWSTNGKAKTHFILSNRNIIQAVHQYE